MPIPHLLAEVPACEQQSIEGREPLLPANISILLQPECLAARYGSMALTISISGLGAA